MWRTREVQFLCYWYTTTGVPNLQDLMPDGLRQSWCNQNRNKEHNKCNPLESFWNHPPPIPQSVEKLSSTESVPGVKKVGDCCIKGHNNGKEQPGWYTMQRGPLVVEPRLWLGFAVFPRLLHHQAKSIGNKVYLSCLPYQPLLAQIYSRDII